MARTLSAKEVIKEQLNDLRLPTLKERCEEALKKIRTTDDAYREAEKVCLYGRDDILYQYIVEYLSWSAGFKRSGLLNKLNEMQQIDYAKKEAKKIGLAYWPAMLYWLKNKRPCNVMAFVYAEQFLAQKHGYYDPSEKKYGGWDSEGFYGVSPRDVLQYWRMAGCKNNIKFRLQLQYRAAALKGQSARKYVLYVEGHRWVCANGFNTCMFSRRSLEMLGKLSPVYRWAAISQAGDYRRISSFNWEQVRKYRDLIKNDPTGRVATALLPKAKCIVGRREDQNLILNVVRFLTPTYPDVPLDIARNLVLGLTPKEISDNELTNKEATEWLKSAKDAFLNSPLDWYKSLFSTNLIRHAAICDIRSIKVLRWLEHKLNMYTVEEWLKERIKVRQNHVEVCAILDALVDEDIVNVTDSFDLVVSRYVKRIKRDGTDKLLKAAEFKRKSKFIRELLTENALKLEGKEMGHCVGGFGPMVKKGQCCILSIKSKAGRSTAEVYKEYGTYLIRQHKGENNTPILPRWHSELLKAYLNNKGKKS